jgi:hypothetical protein
MSRRQLEIPLADGGKTRPLSVVAELFGRLHDERIKYCHWKSNVRLASSMVGTTDLDILVDRGSTGAVRRIFAHVGIKRFAAASYRSYPGVETHVAFDTATGTLVHVHTHFQLTLGEKLLKGHRLPWEQLMLSTRVMDPVHQVYVADPSLELVVLAVRAALKVSARDFLQRRRRRRYLGQQTLLEFRWLAERSDSTRVLQLAGGLIGDEAARQLPELVAHPSFRRLRTFRRSTSAVLSDFRLYGRIQTRALTSAREIALRARAWGRRAGTAPGSPRTLPQGGITVAIVGKDQDLRSNLIQTLEEWLSRHVAVVRATWGGLSALRRIHRAKSRGLIVLVDAGSALRLDSRDGKGDLQAATEPDLVLVLNTPDGDALTVLRDVPTDRGHREEGDRQDNAETELQRIVKLDPAIPWEELLLRAKRAIWHSI